MAHLYVRDWWRKKVRRSEEGVKGTERTSDRADDCVSEERGAPTGEGHTGPNDLKKETPQRKSAEGKRERSIELDVEAREKRDKDEEKRRQGRRGMRTEGKANDTTACRAFSDVIERSETVATGNRKRGR